MGCDSSQPEKCIKKLNTGEKEVLFVFTNPREYTKLFQKMAFLLHQVKQQGKIWKVSLQRINKELGIQSNNSNALHLLQTILSSMVVQNEGEAVQVFISNKHPYIDNKLVKLDKLDTSDTFQTLDTLIEFYRYFLRNTQSCNDIIENILDLSVEIEKAISDTANIMLDQELRRNFNLLSTHLDKVRLFHYTVISPILEDVLYATNNSNLFLHEAAIRGEILLHYKIFSIIKISESILSSPKLSN